MSRNDQWRVKGTADDYANPDTELTPHLLGHGMDATPVYSFVSNPVNQVELSGRHLQVYHVKQDNVRQPVEESINDFLRNRTVQVDPVGEGIQHPAGRVQRTDHWRLPASQFSWVDTSVGTVKAAVGRLGKFIYG